MKRRFEHLFINGRPTGVLTTVEHLKYQPGADDNSDRKYELSELEKWRAYAITTWVLAAVGFVYWLVR